MIYTTFDIDSYTADEFGILMILFKHDDDIELEADSPEKVVELLKENGITAEFKNTVHTCKGFGIRWSFRKIN